VFTARYTLSPYIKQIRFVFKGLIRRLRLALLQSSDSFTEGVYEFMASELVLNFLIGQSRGTVRKRRDSIQPISLDTNQFIFTHIRTRFNL
jgi:hypothetical protein